MSTAVLESEIVDDELFGKTSLPTIFTPLDALISLHKQQKADIERIAGYVQGETDVMSFFMTGAQQTHQYSSFSVSRLFELEPALRALDSYYWGRALDLTDVLEFMPAKRRNEWNSMVRTGFSEVESKEADRTGYLRTVVKKVPIPAFEEKSVHSTLRSMLAQRHQFFAERVDGLWSALSKVHLTNQQEGFSKRMIINRVINYYDNLDHDIGGYIHDLRCVIARFMGRDAPEWRVTASSLGDIARDVTKGSGSGKWYSFDGGAWKVRMYKVGTAHMEIHPEMAWRLNTMLASIHPMAIPSEFRKKPAKKLKEYALVNDLVPFEVLSELSSGKMGHDCKTLSFYSLGKTLSERAVTILKYLGGAKVGRCDWQFDYSFSEAMDYLLRTGQIPETQAYQFYPTQKSLATEVVTTADLKPEHSKLEPSAGQGGIADFMGVENTTCVEISALQCKILEGKGFNTVCADFLSWVPDRLYDRICMNPPFSSGRAEAHLIKAVSCLKEDGVLVAILPAGLRGKTVVEGWNHDYSSVRQGEFEGAGVSVVILKLTKEGI